MNMSVFVVAAAALSLTSSAGAQFLMMPDSTNNRVVLFDPNTGALVNSNYFPLAGGTPIHAMQVGTEVWVSEQVGDRVSRWSLTGTPLGAISGGLDNIRGMGIVAGNVHVTNAGTANGAPGAAVITYDTAGNPLGSFLTPSASSPFGILPYPGGMLVSSSNANDDIHKYSLAGSSLGTFHNSTLSFCEQMDYAANGDVLVAVFTTNVVARLHPVTGALISTFAASGARGVRQLGNGNIMWTSGSGAFVYNVGSGTSSQVYTGGGRYIDFLEVPSPAGAGLLALGGLAAFRRRR